MADNDVVIEPNDEVLNEVDAVEVETTDNTDSDGDLEITIGNEEGSPPTEDDETEKEDDSELIREMRKKLKADRLAKREAERKAEELEKALKSKEVVELPTLEEEPTLEGCDYDDVLFKEKFSAWLDVKKSHESKLKEKQEEVNKANEAYQGKVNAYKEASIKLKVSDFADAETNVTRKLDVTQQGIIVSYAKKPELLVYALGKNQKALDELASTKDPIQYAIAITNLENQLKVTQRKPPPPEGKVTGNSTGTFSDARLNNLYDEAQKTGDYSKYFEYKRQKK